MVLVHKVEVLTPGFTSQSISIPLLPLPDPGCSGGGKLTYHSEGWMLESVSGVGWMVRQAIIVVSREFVNQRCALLLASNQWCTIIFLRGSSPLTIRVCPCRFKSDKAPSNQMGGPNDTATRRDAMLRPEVTKLGNAYHLRHPPAKALSLPPDPFILQLPTVSFMATSTSSSWAQLRQQARSLESQVSRSLYFV